MHILILGGGAFLGAAALQAALAAQHAVSVFNRGRARSAWPEGVEVLTGDRATDLDRLDGRRWDAVIDTCGYVPRVVRMSVEALRDSVDHYTFVSSISAYADRNTPGIGEDAALDVLKEPTEEVTGESYGPLKALCEAEVQRVFGNRALINRPGLLVGPFDPTERFTYWPMRIARGGDVLAPGNPGANVQVIDTRDAARWILDCAERRVGGVFNMTGPAAPLSMEQMLETTRETLNPAARLVWASEKFLLDNEVAPWSDMPVWLPSDVGGVLSVDISRALVEGLVLRPLSETVRDTYEWRKAATDPSAAPTATGAARPKAGIDEARETKLLARWRTAAATGA